MQSIRVDRSGRFACWYVKNAERIAFFILALWCLLPVVMSGYDFIMCALGRFPTDEMLAAEGMSVGSINYNMASDAYYRMFCALGIPTLLFALASVIVSWNRVRSKESVRTMPWFYLLGGLLGWAVVSSALSGNFVRAFTGGGYVHDGLSSYFIYGGVFLCASMLREERHRRNMLRLYCAVMCYLALIMLVQEYLDSDYLNHCFPAYWAVVFLNYNHFGYVLCMATLAMTGLYLYDGTARPATRALYLLGVAFLSYALLVNITFGTYLATLVALPVAYVFYRRSGRRLNLVALLPAIAFLVVSLLDYFGLTPGTHTLLANISQLGNDLRNILSGKEEALMAGSGRMILWQETLGRIGQRPIFGFGPEGFYGDNAISFNLLPHNEYLQIPGFLGIPALILYLGALITLAIHHWKAIKRLPPLVLAAAGSMVCYLASAFFGNPIFNTAPYFWMFFGMTTFCGEGPALLTPSMSDIEARFDQRVDKRRVALIAIALAAILAVGIGVYAHLVGNAEHDNEMADLQAMQIAEYTAKIELQDGQSIASGSHWFDVDTNALLPDGAEMPEPYGLGTQRAGGALSEFISQHDTQYHYDEKTDYRDKCILVTIETEGEAPVISVEWASGQ